MAWYGRQTVRQPMLGCHVEPVSASDRGTEEAVSTEFRNQGHGQEQRTWSWLPGGSCHKEGGFSRVNWSYWWDAKGWWVVYSTHGILPSFCLTSHGPKYSKARRRGRMENCSLGCRAGRRPSGNDLRANRAYPSILGYWVQNDWKTGSHVGLVLGASFQGSCIQSANCSPQT